VVFLKAFGGTLEKVGDPLAQVVSVTCQEAVPLIVQNKQSAFSLESIHPLACELVRTAGEVPLRHWSFWRTDEEEEKAKPPWLLSFFLVAGNPQFYAGELSAARYMQKRLHR
jgi:hypothetical protein